MSLLLAWLGLDWDAPPTFQLDRLEDCRKAAEQLVADGTAYEDDGAIRFRMPDEGTTGWDDIVRGHVEFPNDSLEDLVLMRGDGRPTYNFASPMEDVWDGITDVIRGEDHVSNTPKQINIIRAAGGELPVYAHVPNVLGTDGKKLSKRHGAQGVDELRELAGESGDIADPAGQGADVYRTCRDEIRRCVERIATSLRPPIAALMASASCAASMTSTCSSSPMSQTLLSTSKSWPSSEKIPLVTSLSIRPLPLTAGPPSAGPRPSASW